MWIVTVNFNAMKRHVFQDARPPLRLDRVGSRNVLEKPCVSCLRWSRSSLARTGASERAMTGFDERQRLSL